MNHMPARIVAQLLFDLGASGGVGVRTATWPVYVGPTPNLPDNVLVVKDTSGTDESDLLTAGDPDYRYGVQIMVRSRDEIDGMKKAHAVGTALRTVHNRAVRVQSSVYVVPAVTATGPPVRVGEETEASERHLHSLNPRLTIRPL